MTAFSIAFVLVTIIITACDLSSLLLTEKDTALLYVDENYVENDDENTENLFGTSTISQEIDQEDLVDFDAVKQAEEALNQIYNGGK